MKLVTQIDQAEPAGEPEDRIGKANQAYRDNLESLQADRDALKPSTSAAFAGGVVNGASLHTLPMLQAAVMHPISVLPGGDRSAYIKERDDVQKSLDEAKEAHPYAYGAGDIAGSALPALATGGTTALGRVAQAAVLTGVSSGADSLSHGEDFAKAGQKAVIGGAAGTVLGGAGELLGAGVSSAFGKKAAEAGGHSVEDQAVNDTLQDFIGPSAPRKIRKPLGEMFNAETETQPIAAPTYKPRDLLLHEDFKPLRDEVMAAAKRGDREAVDESLEHFNTALNAKKAPIAESVDAIKKATAGGVVNDIDTTIFKLKGEHGTAATQKALEELKTQLQDTWSSADATKVQNDLGRFAASKATPEQEAAINEMLGKLPTKGYVTRADITEAAGDLIKDPKIRTELENIPTSFHAQIERPYTDLREAVTAAQNSVHDTLGTIAETEHAKLKQAVTSQLNKSLEGHLNEVARTSPEAEALVRKLRNSDVLQSSTLSLKRANEQAMEQATTNSLSLKSRTSNVAGNVVGGEQAVSAGLAAAEGNFGKAALHLGGAVAAKVLPGAAEGVGKSVTRSAAEATYNNTGVGKVLKLAAAGNARAQALARRLGLPGWTKDVRQAVSTAAKAKAAGRVGNAVSSVVDGDQDVGSAVSGFLGTQP